MGLLIVVVIAILAAITIVADNGITNRAKASAASSAAGQAAKKVMTYATVNADQYPTALSDAGVSDGSATYQYRVDNDANPKTFCVTATSQNVSYTASSTATAPVLGACPGHGINGVSAITNLVLNPGFEGAEVQTRATSGQIKRATRWARQPHARVARVCVELLVRTDRTQLAGETTPRALHLAPTECLSGFDPQ